MRTRVQRRSAALLALGQRPHPPLVCYLWEEVRPHLRCSAYRQNRWQHAPAYAACRCRWSLRRVFCRALSLCHPPQLLMETYDSSVLGEILRHGGVQRPHLGLAPLRGAGSASGRTELDIAWRNRVAADAECAPPSGPRAVNVARSAARRPRLQRSHFLSELPVSSISLPERQLLLAEVERRAAWRCPCISLLPPRRAA